MSIAMKAGRGLGKAIGWSAATAFKGAVMAAEATGEFGEAAYDGMTESFDDRCAAMDAAREARHARAQARKAELLAARQQPVAVEAPKARKAKVAA